MTSPEPALQAILCTPAARQAAERIIRRRRIHDLAEPDELVNHVWIKITTAINRDPDAFKALDSDQKRRSYIHRALSNAASDFLRQVQRRPQLLDFLPDVLAPAAKYVSPDKAKLVARIIRDLRPRLNDAARCRLEVMLSGQSVAAYAVAHGISLQAAQRQFVRGKWELREKLEQAMVKVFGLDAWVDYVDDVALATLAALVNVDRKTDDR